MRIQPYLNICFKAKKPHIMRSYFKENTTYGGVKCADICHSKDPYLYAQMHLMNLLRANINKICRQRTKENEFEKIYARMQLADIDIEEGRKFVSLNTEAVENLFKNDCDFYIGPNPDNILYNKFENYLKTGKNIDVPTIELFEEKDNVVLNFIDGRHRFSVLRDMGMSEIPFALDEESVKIAQKHGIIAL